MSGKRIVLNSLIGFLILWGIWKTGAWVFSPQTMSFIVSTVFLGYMVFICHRVGQTVVSFVFSHIPSLPFPKISSFSKLKFARSKSVFDAPNDNE